MRAPDEEGGDDNRGDARDPERRDTDDQQDTAPPASGGKPDGWLRWSLVRVRAELLGWNIVLVHLVADQLIADEYEADEFRADE